MKPTSHSLSVRLFTLLMLVACLGCKPSKTIPPPPTKIPAQGQKRVFALGPKADAKLLIRQKAALQRRLQILGLYNSFVKQGKAHLCVFLAKQDFDAVALEGSEFLKRSKQKPSWFTKLLGGHSFLDKIPPLEMSDRVALLAVQSRFQMYKVEDDDPASKTYLALARSAMPRYVVHKFERYSRMGGSYGADQIVWSEKLQPLLKFAREQNAFLKKNKRFPFQWMAGRYHMGPGKMYHRLYLLRTKAILPANSVTQAKVVEGFSGSPVLSVKLTSAQASAFESWTAKNIGKRIAIVVDDQVQSAPVVQSRIGGGRIQISPSVMSRKAAYLDTLALSYILDPSQLGRLPKPMTFETVSVYKKVDSKVSSCP